MRSTMAAVRGGRESAKNDITEQKQSKIRATGWPSLITCQLSLTTGSVAGQSCWHAATAVCNPGWACTHMCVGHRSSACGRSRTGRSRQEAAWHSANPSGLLPAPLPRGCGLRLHRCCSPVIAAAATVLGTRGALGRAAPPRAAACFVHRASSLTTAAASAAAAAARSASARCSPACAVRRSATSASASSALSAPAGRSAARRSARGWARRVLARRWPPRQPRRGQGSAQRVRGRESRRGAVRPKQGGA